MGFNSRHSDMRSRKSIWHNNLYAVINNFKGHSFQRFSAAWAGNAFAIVDRKKRTVVGTLDQCFTAIQKLVGHPFERGADVGAFVAVKINFAAFFHRKEQIVVDMKALAAWLGNVIDMTQGEIRGHYSAGAARVSLRLRI